MTRSVFVNNLNGGKMISFKSILCVLMVLMIGSAFCHVIASFGEPHTHIVVLVVCISVVVGVFMYVLD